MRSTCSVSNDLLSSVTNYLKGNYNDPPTINTLLNKASSSSLLSLYSFLGMWISTNYENNSAKIGMNKIIYAAKLLGIVSKKIPSSLLITQTYNHNFGFFQPHWILYDFFKPMDLKIYHLWSYFKQFAINGHSIPLCSRMPDFYSLNRFNDSEIDSSFNTASIINFKRLLVNHTPIEAFKPYISQKNSKVLLTKAIIELINEYNSLKGVTQFQITFSFSCLFLYVHSFINSNDIDGQMLAQAFNGLPFISPFCILAIVNHIPTNLYLFNLLTPKKVAESLQQLNSLDNNYLNIIDFSVSSPKINVSAFIEKIPIIASNYFLSVHSYNFPDNFNTSDENEFLSFIHLSSVTMYNKMKGVLSVAHKRQLTPFHVSMMGILLLRCITFSLQRTLVDCADTEMFNSSFCYFVKTVFSILAPSFASQISPKFFDTKETNKRIIDLTLRGAFFHIMPSILGHPNIDHVVSYCIYAGTFPESMGASRLMIGKIMQNDSPKITKSVLNSLTETDDALILLEYIDFITSYTNVVSFSEQSQLNECRAILINKLQITESSKPHLFIIDRFKPIKGLNEQSNSAFEKLSKITIQNAIKEIHSLIDSYDSSPYFILKMISLTSFMMIKEVAKKVVDTIKTMLSSFSNDFDQTKFEIRPCDYGLIIGESLMGRLLVFKFSDLALSLLESMLPSLSIDSTPLHWIFPFTVNYRTYLTPEIRNHLGRIVAGLPNAKDLFIGGDDAIFLIAKSLIDHDSPLIQDPDAINSEYQSPYMLSKAFSICSLMLSTTNDIEMSSLLASPLFNIARYWPNRNEAALNLSHIAAAINPESSKLYFENILNNIPNHLGLVSGRLFLMECRLDVYVQICTQCKQLIANNHTKLDYFMKMAMPSFVRISGNIEVASGLVSGLLECITNDTPYDLQERVIDIICLVHIKINPLTQIKKIMESAINVKEDLRKVLAICLDSDAFVEL